MYLIHYTHRLPKPYTLHNIMANLTKRLLIYFFVSRILALPSLDHTSFDDARKLRALGSMRDPSIGDLVIRGVHGGRKKRYVIERQDNRKCCRGKICLSVMGEILDKDCKCRKCPTGVPALDGKICQDNCPDGKKEKHFRLSCSIAYNWTRPGKE
jgi:hypothetical protein